MYEYVAFCYVCTLCVCMFTVYIFLSVSRRKKIKRRNNWLLEFLVRLDLNMKLECKNKRSHLCKYDVYLSNFTH